MKLKGRKVERVCFCKGQEICVCLHRCPKIEVKGGLKEGNTFMNQTRCAFVSVLIS